MSSVVCIRVRITGRVQMVGFRLWTQKHAQLLGLRGWVRNCYDGRVEALFLGERRIVEEMIKACYQGPLEAVVSDIEEEVVTVYDEGLVDFTIAPTV